MHHGTVVMLHSGTLSNRSSDGILIILLIILLIVLLIIIIIIVIILRIMMTLWLCS